MKKNGEIHKLLKSLLIATETHSIQRINEFINGLITESEDISDKMEKAILKAICEKYSVTYDILINGKSNQHIVKVKRVAFCVLHLILNQPSRYIANKVFMLSYHNSVADAIKMYKNTNEKIKAEKDFKDEVDSTIETIKQKIKNLKNGN
jgi:hypothetical protein